MIAVWLFAGLAVIFIAAGAMWVVKAAYLRPDRVRPTYQITGTVYRDPEGFEWIVAAPGRLRLLGSDDLPTASAARVAETHGPLVWVRNEETP